MGRFVFAVSMMKQGSWLAADWQLIGSAYCGPFRPAHVTEVRPARSVCLVRLN